MYTSWMWKQRSYREQFQDDESGAAGGADVASQQQGDEEAGQQAEGEMPAAEPPVEPAAEGEDDADEVVITLGDEAPPASEDEVDGKPAPQWVKELRKQARELARENRELKQAQQAAAQPAAPSVGERPTLEDCGWDADVYAEKLLAWNDAKRTADAAAETARKEQEAAQEAWNQRLTAYKAAGAQLKVADFADAEAVAQDVFSPTQLGIIVNGADNAAHLVYALGKNPAKAKELAAIKDPVKYAFAVAKLETQLKVTPRKAPPAPERKVSSTAAGAVSVDNTLARLEAEADKTGDRSKVFAYKQQQRKAQAA